ncbi:protein TRIGALACTOSYLDIACYLGLYCEROL 2, chloroplastic-like [Macadamia integrifolia]|uniref:protein TRIGALACTOSYLDIACYLGLYCEROL 2, chloroplastic-like n=1 Tax=Macadamia integrifolia TaxID=60698 RepID=UPI001C530CCD|nr:protein TRIGALACTOSYLDIACYLGLYCEROL 2, chloroplastic-like [Macadamia integrifolia]
MVGSPWVQVSTGPNVLRTPQFVFQGESSRNFLPYRPLKKLVHVRASSADTGQSFPAQSSSSSERKNPLAVIMDVPGTIWRQTLRPLSDFGFGKRSIWEGGVGLFVVSGAVLFALSWVWLRGFYLRSRLRKYQAVFEFTQACGISMGTPVRIRGVTVGNVIRINPSLKSIEAVVEVEDDKVIIPQNSLIEVNQSGLLMETLIDITPRDPLPTPSVGPLDPECVKEGLIVCDRQKIKGRQGVSVDALVGIFTRLGREMEEIGVSKTYEMVERVASVIQEAKPLLKKIEAMAEDVHPLLAEVSDSGLLKEVESLTRTLTEAAEDLRRVHSSIMTPENTELIQQSIYTLIFTLKNIESISSDISGFTGDEATRRNLKLLIKSLSRLL